MSSNWRIIQVAKDKAFDSTSGTDTIVMPRTHQISTIYLVVKAENGSTNNAVASGAQQSVEEAITKIELISGGKTFRKMTGEMCRRIDAYETGRHPWEERTQEGGKDQLAMFRLPFGLEPYDRDVILAAPLLGSLDLIIDYDFTQHASLGFATGLYYDVYIDALKPEPVEVMQSKLTRVIQQKGTYTTTGAGEKRFDLTTDPDRMLRRVYVQAYERVIREGVDIDRLGLYVDNVEVANVKWEVLQAINASDKNLSWIQHVELDPASTSDVFQTRVPNVKPSMAPGSTGGVEYVDSVAGDELTLSVTANELSYLNVESAVVPTVAVLDFDKVSDMAELISQGVMSLELMLNDAASGGAVKYFEESLVRGWL